MFNKILDFWLKKRTKDFTEIPLVFINFDYKKYSEDGEKGSCMVHFHPDLFEDKELHRMIYEVVDYIREHNDMEKFTHVIK